VSVDVRPEHPGDAAAVARINREAFGGEVEAELVERLRADGETVVSLVADEDGDLVGHILFSRLPITHDGQVLEAVALAPMAVRPGWQRQGLGGRLVREGLAACAERGARAAVVVGHPEYYPRFGFSADAARGIAAPYAGSDAFMALRLDDSSEPLTGVARYAAAFAALA
jgi:putative acetyltransferase